MGLILRLRRLEQKKKANRQLWAVFTIGYYDNPIEQQKTQEQLVDEYIAQGNNPPTHRVFINEVPSPGIRCQEGFLDTFSK